MKAVIPGAAIELTEGRNAGGGLYLDTTRLREDTGFEPAYGIELAVADYIAWLRAGHER